MKPAFFLTTAETASLRVLARQRYAWPGLDPRTVRSLMDKGLVGVGAAPGLTRAGRLAVELLDALALERGSIARSSQKSLARPSGVASEGNSAVGGSVVEKSFVYPVVLEPSAKAAP